MEMVWDEDDKRTRDNSENAHTFDHGELGFSFFFLLPLSPQRDEDTRLPKWSGRW
jgi:hypothetical protein